MKTAAIIICYNRSKFVIRLLEYYKKHNYIFFYIGFVGTQNEFNILKTYKKKNLLNINLIKINKKPLFHNLSEVLFFVKEKYVIFMEDDNFIIPKTIKKCSIFLKNNKDYSSANGWGLIYDLNYLKGVPKNFNIYPMNSALSNDIKTRINFFYQSMFLAYLGVLRTKEFKLDLCKLSEFNDINFHELLLNTLIIIRGKTKRFKELFIIRQYPRPDIYNIPEPYKWVSSKEWHKSYVCYKEILIKKLHLKNINKTEANILINNVIKKYIYNRFNSKFKISKKSNKIKYKKNSLILKIKNILNKNNVNYEDRYIKEYLDIIYK